MREVAPGFPHRLCEAPLPMECSSLDRWCGRRTGIRARDEVVMVVSTLPPCRDGIAAYASQMVLSLREAGHGVRAVGLPGSDADAVLDVAGGARPLRLIPHCRGSSRV